MCIDADTCKPPFATKSVFLFLLKSAATWTEQCLITALDWWLRCRLVTPGILKNKQGASKKINILMSHLVQIKVGVINDDTGGAAHWDWVSWSENKPEDTRTDTHIHVGLSCFPPSRYQFPTERASVCKYMCGCRQAPAASLYLPLSPTHTSRNTLCF